MRRLTKAQLRRVNAALIDLGKDPQAGEDTKTRAFAIAGWIAWLFGKDAALFGRVEEAVNKALAPRRKVRT